MRPFGHLKYWFRKDCRFFLAPGTSEDSSSSIKEEGPKGPPTEKKNQFHEIHFEGKSSDIFIDGQQIHQSSAQDKTIPDRESIDRMKTQLELDRKLVCSWHS